jgi:hypothetical protein
MVFAPATTRLHRNGLTFSIAPAVWTLDQPQIDGGGSREYFAQAA